MYQELADGLNWLHRFLRDAAYLHPFAVTALLCILLLALVLFVLRRLEESKVEADLGHVFGLVPNFRDPAIFALPRRVLAISFDETQLGIVRRKGLQSLLSVYSAEDIAEITLIINREIIPLRAITGFSLAMTVNAVLRQAAEAARSTWAVRGAWRLDYLAIEIRLLDDVDPVHTLVFLAGHHQRASAEAASAVAEADVWCYRLQSIFQAEVA